MNQSLSEVNAKPMQFANYFRHSIENRFSAVCRLNNWGLDGTRFKGCMRCRAGAVVTALASRQCGLGLIPRLDTILLILYPAPKGFSPGTPVFPSVDFSSSTRRLVPFRLSFVDEHCSKLPSVISFKKIQAPVSKEDETISRGTQRECSSKPLKHSIVKRILVFKR